MKLDRWSLFKYQLAANVQHTRIFRLRGFAGGLQSIVFNLQFNHVKYIKSMDDSCAQSEGVLTKI